MADGKSVDEASRDMVLKAPELELGDLNLQAQSVAYLTDVLRHFQREQQVLRASWTQKLQISEDECSFLEDEYHCLLEEFKACTVENIKLQRRLRDLERTDGMAALEGPGADPFEAGVGTSTADGSAGPSSLSRSTPSPAPSLPASPATAPSTPLPPIQSAQGVAHGWLFISTTALSWEEGEKDEARLWVVLDSALLVAYLDPSEIEPKLWLYLADGATVERDKVGTLTVTARCNIPADNENDKKLSSGGTDALPEISSGCGGSTRWWIRAQTEAKAAAWGEQLRLACELAGTGSNGSGTEPTDTRARLGNAAVLAERRLFSSTSERAAALAALEDEVLKAAEASSVVHDGEHGEVVSTVLLRRLNTARRVQIDELLLRLAACHQRIRCFERIMREQQRAYLPLETPLVDGEESGVGKVARVSRRGSRGSEVLAQHMGLLRARFSGITSPTECSRVLSSDHEVAAVDRIASAACSASTDAAEPPPTPSHGADGWHGKIGTENASCPVTPRPLSPSSLGGGLNGGDASPTPAAGGGDDKLAEAALAAAEAEWAREKAQLLKDHDAWRQNVLTAMAKLQQGVQHEREEHVVEVESLRRKLAEAQATIYELSAAARVKVDDELGSMTGPPAETGTAVDSSSDSSSDSNDDEATPKLPAPAEDASATSNEGALEPAPVVPVAPERGDDERQDAEKKTVGGGDGSDVSCSSAVVPSISPDMTATIDLVSDSVASSLHGTRGATDEEITSVVTDDGNDEANENKTFELEAPPPGAVDRV